MSWLNMAVVALCLFTVQGTNAQMNSPPIIATNLQLRIPENTPQGSTIGILNITDSDYDHITVTTDAYTDIYVTLVEITSGNGYYYANVTLRKEIDYESLAGNPIILSFSATDGQSFAPVTAQIRLFITDVNDNPPRFNNQPYATQIPESTSPGSIVFTATATDTETGAGGQVYYSLLTNTDKFNMSNSTGTIRLIKKVDYEDVPFYRLRLLAKDGGNLNSTADLFLTVTDVQDTPPYFTGLPYLREIREDLALHSTICTVSAQDGDRGNPDAISFTVENSTCPGYFRINTSGEVILNATADRDEGPVANNNGICVLTVKASEDIVSSRTQYGNSTTATEVVTVTVKDINDNSPYFTESEYTASVQENTPAGVPITFSTPLNVTDIDQGAFAKIKLALHNYTECFELVPDTVQGSATVLVKVKNSSVLDFEQREEIALQVLAIQEGRRNSSATIHLNITNENDNSPKFRQTLYTASVKEGSPASTSVTVISATDSDLPPFNIISYTLLGSDGKFAINDTGAVRVTSHDTDRETRPVYYLTVEATDSGGRKETTQLTVHITDANDNNPRFIRDYDGYLKENGTQFNRPIRVQATDDDIGQNAQVHYSIIMTYPSGYMSHFHVNRTTGEVSVTLSLDYESMTSNQLDVVVRAKDSGSPSLHSDVNVTIIVQDINDNEPIFSQTSYHGSVKEDSRKGKSILTVNASDADGTPQNSEVFYMLEGTGSDKFLVHGETGIISVVGTLDREDKSQYNLTVRAMDRGTPPLNSTARVFINVLDVNDDKPTFPSQTKTEVVDETNNIGGILYTMPANDKDPDADLKYSVFWNESSAVNEDSNNVDMSRIQQILQLNTTTGEIKLIGGLDREEVEVITLKLQVIDLKAVANKPQTATATLTLNVLDADDNTPTFSDTSYSAEIVENSQPGIPITLTSSAAITVSDIDKDLNSVFSLSLLNHSDVFEVIPSTVRSSATVIIRVKDSTKLDYETRRSMTLILLAKETKVSSPLQQNVTIFLNITDANDHDPSFNQSEYTGSIPEKSPNGTSILTVTATDEDTSEFGLGNYSIQGSQSRFKIDYVTGELSVAYGTGLDRETQDTYQLTVEAVDKGGRRSSAQIIVTLTDINDNSPVFKRVEYNANLREGAHNFSRTLQIETTDADERGTRNSLVTYTIFTSGLSANFSIDHHSGILSPINPIDYELLPANTPEIELVVTASDHGTPQHENNITVIIQVEDVNDNEPLFNQSYYTARIRENAHINTPVVQVFATDADGTTQNSAVFYMLEGQGSDKFQISGATGLISKVGDINREEVSQYKLTVRVMDRGTPPLNSTAEVVIDVINVNDEVPSFPSEIMSKQVNETNDKGSILYRMSATDTDSNSDLLYSVFWNESSAYNEDLVPVDMSYIQHILHLDNSTGALQLNGDLDREKVETITLKFHVVDLNGVDNNPQTATATLKLTVLDIDDNPPTFNDTYFTAEIVENSQRGIPISLDSTRTITVSDQDKDLNSIFSLSLLNHDEVFEVVPITARSIASAIIRVKNATYLDYEKRNHMNLTLVAKETRSQAALSASVMIFLQIKDANDHIPMFNQTEYVAYLPENSTFGDTVLSVLATDEDSTKYGMGTYQLQGSESSFVIDNTTGKVSVADGSELDRETKVTYRLTVEAVDKGGLRSSVPVRVTLTDINDNSPVFKRVEYNANLQEGSDHFTRQVQLEATDADEEGTTNSNVSYIIHSSGLSANFSIDAVTGVLKTKRPIDFESLPGHRPNIHLIVIATDHGHPPLSANVTVNILVEDINDNEPVFSQTFYKGNISEDANTDSKVLQVFATDADGTTQNSAVFYTLEGQGSDKFQINGATGVISKVGDINREEVSQYNLTVRVMDRGTPPLNSTAEVVIDVINVNDEVPSFLSETVSTQVNETNSTGTILYTMSATDRDPDANLFYIVFWNESSAYNEDLKSINMSRIQEILRLNSATGALRLIGDLDREEVEVITLKFHVEDQNADNPKPQIDTATLILTVLDIDDNTPTFNTNTLTAQIAENSQPGIPISLESTSAITVTDEDKDLNSIFSLSLTTHNDVFDVVPSLARSFATIIIRVKDAGHLDYESQKDMELTLVANETRVQNPRSSSMTISLHITDANDHDPRFNKTEYKARIPENSKRGFSVLNVSATDEDSSKYNLAYYTFQGSQSNFAINNVTGEVTVADGSDLDREKQNTYRLTVEAVDKGDRTSSVPITVTLSDVNDNRPVFRQLEYIANLQEGMDNFTSPMLIETTDADDKNTNNSVVSYQIQSPSSGLARNFSIDANGLLTPKRPVDFELLPDYKPDIELIVVATDNGTPKLSSNVTVTIRVEDVNDNTPMFNQTTYRGNISEAARTNKRILQVFATDADGTTQNRAVFYLLEGQGSDKFQISGATGVISKVGDINREEVSQYNLTVRVMDRGTPPLNSTAEVVIDVINVNDEVPSFLSETVSTQVKETNSTGTILYTMSATDRDPDANLFYTMFWNESSAYNENLGRVSISQIQRILQLNSSTGDILLKNGLDREKVEVIQLKLHVADLNAEDDAQTQTATATLRLTVLDVDDNTPSFNSHTYTADIVENSQPGIPISLRSPNAITVSDTDKDLNSVFSLSLLNYADVFEVVPNMARSLATVIIRVQNSTELDYESIQFLNLTLLANETQVLNPLHSEVTINLRITDANDHIPVFGHPGYNVSIPENSQNGYEVVNITATDDDSSLYNMGYYRLQGSQTNFEINGDTGVVFVAGNSDLDREKQDTYRLTVDAVDKGGLRSSVPIIITLTDVNDNRPVFRRLEYNANLKEGADNFTRPLQIETTDADEKGTQNTNVSYTILSQYAGNFTISNKGVLTPNNPIDYERLLAPPNIKMVVRATDMGSPSLSNNVTVTIQVEDINDNAPSFLNEPYSVSIPENATDGSFVITVSGNDNDGEPPNNQIMFVIDSGGSDNFRMDGRSGNISVQTGASLNRELDSSYNLVILAIDQGTPPMSASASVSVTISDVNDEPPVFHMAANTANVSENSTSVISVYRMIATDPDVNPLLNYSILWDSSRAFDERDGFVDVKEVKNWFSINPSTGEVSAHPGVIDRETAEKVTLSVQVVDIKAEQSSPQQTATTSLTVTIDDTNDNFPEIAQGSIISLNVSEGTRIGTVILTLDASDRDKRQSVTFNTTSTFFSITAEGRISLAKELDREKQPSMNFPVTATDSGSPKLTSTANISVIVLDTNDNDPNFTTIQSVFPVAENSPSGTHVAKLEAKDKDEGANANVTFLFADYFGDHFSINPITGEVKLEETVDREAKSSYTLTIIARDNPSFETPRRVRKDITINVTDVNDNNPSFSRDYSTKVSERTDKGGDIITVTATDDDVGINAVLWYSLDMSSNGSSLFVINPNSGQITAKRNLTGLADTYEVTVIATDMGVGNLTGNTSVIVIVLDENLNPPVFVDTGDIAPVPECAKPGSVIYQFSATDADRDKIHNAKVEFKMTDDTAQDTKNYFQLVSSGVLRTSFRLDSELKDKFTLKVMAYDLGVPQLSTISREYIIKVKDTNDNPPKFNVSDVSQREFSVDENLNTVRLGPIRAFDPDKDSTICYDIEEDATNKLYVSHLKEMKSDNQSAYIVVEKPFDRENVTEFQVVVTANDCSPPYYALLCAKNFTEQQQSDSTTITIRINDVNDNPPMFTSDLLSAGIRNNAEVGKVIIDLSTKVTDPDTPLNSVHDYIQVNSTEADSQLLLTSFDPKTSEPLKLDKDGLVATNMKFTATMVGFLTMRVAVSDSAGTDFTELRVYIIADFQVLRITFLQTPEELRKMQEEVLEQLSRDTGFTFLVNDEIKSHVDPEGDGRITETKSDMYIHAVDPATGKILDALKSQSVIDNNQGLTQALVNKFKVLQVGEADAKPQVTDDTSRFIYILGAMVALLAFTLVLLITIACQRIQRYQRKLKAATLEVHAPTRKEPSVTGVVNVNPIFNKEMAFREETEDAKSVASDESLDHNAVTGGDKKLVDDEQEVTVDFYNEEQQIRYREMYLDEALRRYDFIDDEMEQRGHDVGDSGSSGSEPGDVNKKKRFLPFEKKGFESLENLESSDI